MSGVHTGIINLWELLSLSSLLYIQVIFIIIDNSVVVVDDHNDDAYVCC